MKRLDQRFYGRSAREVAVDLLGKSLVRTYRDIRISGRIVETEAYCDSEELDLACHGDRANKGRPTPRTQVMFGPPGHAYVYFTYGMHWMFNIVTGEEHQANAVLIRALEPMEGLDAMMSLRDQRPLSELTNGPAKLAQALAIDSNLNGVPLFDKYCPIWVEEPYGSPVFQIAVGPRIGLGNTPEPWLSMPWRYWIQDCKYVSK